MSQLGAGDDRAILRALTPTDPTRPAQAVSRALGGMNPNAGILEKAGSFASLLANLRAAAQLGEAHCDLAGRLAGRLGMAPGVVDALGQIYERWDGKGSPLGTRAEAIRSGARVLHLSWRIAAHGLLEGPAAAASVVADRAGTEFLPRTHRRARLSQRVSR
jgi:hypothetical protein